MTDTDPMALATRLVDLEARKADLELEIKRIKAELLAAAEPGDTIAVGGINLYRVTQRRNFNADIAADTLPAEVAAAATVTKIDGAAVKRISPALWESCCTLSEPYLTAVRA